MVAIKQPRQARIGFEGNHLKGDQPLPHQRQRAEHALRLGDVGALQDQHGVGSVLPEINLPQDAGLLEFPDAGGFRF